MVSKLFNIVKPDIAYFGLKDFQQQVIIKKMVKDLNLGIKIAGLPTVREPDGLAMSSRNTYLSLRERTPAAVLYKSLKLAKKLAGAGERNTAKIVGKVKSLIQKTGVAKIDYVEICDSETFEPLKIIKGKALLALAVWIGKTRLIDNAILIPKRPRR